MATVTIIDANSGVASRTKSVDYPKASFDNLQSTTKVTDIIVNKKVIGAVDYSIFDLADLSPIPAVENIGTYRIRFSNIGIVGYPAGYAAPIGIAIIGYNNLIL